MAHAGVNSGDLLDRLQVLKLQGASDLTEKDIGKADISGSVHTVCCDLAQRAASSSASAKLAAKSVQAADVRSQQFLDALRQLDRAVCGPLKDRSQSWQQCVERLVAHIQATHLQELSKRGTTEAAQRSEETTVDAASQALGQIACIVKASAADTAQAQIAALEEPLQAMLRQMPEGYFDCLVSEASVDPSQRAKLEHIFGAMQQEYAMRRKMLIERARVTLQSMLWSKEWLQSQGTLQKATEAAKRGEESLVEAPSVTLEDVFQARIGDVIAVTSKATHGDQGKFEASVKSVIIGEVPDRGGKPLEGRAASQAASMPAWAPRSSSRGGGRGGGRGGQGGGRGAHGGGRGAGHGRGYNRGQPKRHKGS